MIPTKTGINVPFKYIYRLSKYRNSQYHDISVAGPSYLYNGNVYTGKTASLYWSHDDVIKWKHFPRYWPFVRGIHRSPVNSPHKGQWRGALMFSLICVWINGWVINREAGDLSRYRAHYDVTVMTPQDSHESEAALYQGAENSSTWLFSFKKNRLIHGCRCIYFVFIHEHNP